MALSITLRDYFSPKVTEALNAAGQDSLALGVNYTYKGKIYNFQMLETKTDDAKNTMVIFRIYSNTEAYARYYVKGKKNEQGDRLYTPIHNEARNAMIKPYDIIRGGEIDFDAETPTFEGVLSAKETAFYEKYALMPKMKEAAPAAADPAGPGPAGPDPVGHADPDPVAPAAADPVGHADPDPVAPAAADPVAPAPPKTSWSRKQKGVALAAVTLIALAALAYGGKKLKDHGKLRMPTLPSMPDLSAYNPMKLWRKETSV